jgi:multimeric flavodoxin WrbA
MLNILTLIASPVSGSNCEIILEHIAEGIIHSATVPVDNEIVRLNDYMYLPCQSCGKSPEPDFCLFQDEIYPVYDSFINCDIVLFGSPVYFDTVSAQAKLFIDRCNCLRPYDFENEGEHDFKKILKKKRLGAMVLIGGSRQDFECARKVIAGFYKWTEIENYGLITYSAETMKAGEVIDKADKLNEAFTLGQQIASKLIIDGVK